MRALTAINLVAYLALGVIDQNLALATFNEDNETGHEDHQDTDDQRGQRMHRTGTNQFQQATNGIRQSGGDTSEDDDRDAVTQAAFRDLLTQPHQEHGPSE
ncbi:hypothetical protein SDC9_100134 [bioreactor metagenome]|uniref:Uncharacterized protein n=1 Tax=bioreactor metagenome TaxID=1076179 RepID=A0A645AK10_9ZZZZ